MSYEDWKRENRAKAERLMKEEMDAFEQQYCTGTCTPSRQGVITGRGLTHAERPSGQQAPQSKPIPVEVGINVTKEFEKITGRG